ncbi:MAG: DegT/DnrJ/EryC1/StrS family aminotransferase [Oligoflexia bacterium]|nr:DegT/DnrJ/EryC1/StrS family aminotransferase [Oligoflexia bacterium]
MSIPFYNFAELHHDEFRKEVKERISKIIDDGSFVEGEFNHQFETEFAQKQGAKHCLLVANGTDALEIALLAYDIKPGDKVGIPGITFYATGEAVLNVGATPILIDVDPSTGLMCPESVKRMSEAHDLKAIMPVHIYGLPCDMKALENVCSPKGIKIIEDAAQAQGAFVEIGKPVGSTNSLVTFSFYPTKNLSAFGDAGCILTQDDSMVEKIKAIRNHGRGSETLLGRNSRCDHIQAAVLQLKLKDVDRLNEQRKKHAKKYHELLEGLPFKLLDSKYIELSSWHLYPIQFESEEMRKKAQQALTDHNIGCTPFYERSMKEEKVLSQCEGESENANNFSGKTLNLPIHPFVREEDQIKIRDILKNAL